MRKWIAIEGNLGAGKSTLAKTLHKIYDGRLVLERFLNNPHLKDLYAGKKEAMLPAELFFLNDRINQLSSELPDSGLIISDYHIEKTRLFAEANLSSTDYLGFNQKYQSQVTDEIIPNGLIYIKQTPEEALTNIRSRNRSLETEVDLDYLSRIHSHYEVFINHVKQKVPVLAINSETYRKDEPEILKLIQHFLTYNQFV